MVLPEPAAFEIDLTLGPSWPAIVDESCGFLACPAEHRAGAQPTQAGRTDLYVGLQPLQSSSFTAFGAIPAEARPSPAPGQPGPTGR